MPNNPRLNIYTIRLNPSKNNGSYFKDFIKNCLVKDSVKDNNLPDADLFNTIFSRFIQTLDGKKFTLNEQKKKAIQIHNNSKTTSFDSKLCRIVGSLEGGRYGDNRTRSSISNRQNRDDIPPDDVILYSFYYYLYLPVNSKVGVLMLQSFSDESINDTFIPTIRKLLSGYGKYKQAHIDTYIPKDFIKQFIAGSVINKFTYKNSYLKNFISGKDIEEDDYDVTIEVKPNKGAEKKDIKILLKELGRKIFSNQKLKDFNKGRVHLTNTQTNKSCSFSIGDDFNIKPKIYLDDILDNNYTSDDITAFCQDLLDNHILREIHHTDEAREL